MSSRFIVWFVVFYVASKNRKNQYNQQCMRWIMLFIWLSVDVGVKILEDLLDPGSWQELLYLMFLLFKFVLFKKAIHKCTSLTTSFPLENTPTVFISNPHQVYRWEPYKVLFQYHIAWIHPALLFEPESDVVMKERLTIALVGKIGKYIYTKSWNYLHLVEVFVCT